MPGWLLTAGQAIRRGEYGSHDIEETLTDATDIAINDQLKAGIDILVDGEMRRLDFVMGFYDHLQGLRLLPPRRTMGPEGHDMRPNGKCWSRYMPLKACGRCLISVIYRGPQQVRANPSKLLCPALLRFPAGSIRVQSTGIGWR